MYKVKPTPYNVLMSTDNRLSVKSALKLLAVGGLVVSSLAAPNLLVAYQFLSKKWRKYRNGDIGRLVRRLHKRELVRVKEVDGKTIIELSDKGKKKLLEYNFEELNLRKRRDGKLRVVIFDIPNTKKLAREIFREKLKQLGFMMLQKSVFMSSYVCQSEMEFIVNYLGIEGNVILLKVDKVELGPEFRFQPVYK